MKAYSELQAGLFIIGAIILFTGGVWILGQERQIFSRQYEYQAHFKDVGGLSAGAPVRLGGITIGRIQDITFTSNVQQPKVRVELLVNEEFAEYLRADSIATIQTQGLLGDKFLSITPGTGEQSIKPGDEIKSRELIDLGALTDRVTVIIDNISKFSTDFSKMMGDLEGNKLEKFSTGLAALSDIINEVQSGEGLVHRLIYSKQDSDQLLGSLSSAAIDISDIVSGIRSGRGLLHALIYDDQGIETVSSVRTAADNLADTAARLSNLASQIEHGDGLAHDLFFSTSPQGLAETIDKLHTTADNLAKASEALASGSGTLGALLIDSKLYDNLVEVTDDAKRSFILRQAIRSSLREQEQTDPSHVCDPDSANPE